MRDRLLVEKSGSVVTLTLNMPETRNALSDGDFCSELTDQVERLGGDMSVGCIVLTGAGDAFCSGGNLKHIRDRTEMFGGDALTVKENYRTGIQKLARTIWDSELPIIAAVNGPAYGAGCDLALMCDIRIASSKARFAESFVQLGLIPGDGGSWLLPRQIGLSRAAEMTFTADPINAATALKWGLVSSVVSEASLMKEAHALAARIARHPPRQLRMSKRLLREGLNSRFESVLELASIYQGVAHQTADHTEAVQALIERRSPKFTGK
ncbi:enoyl-CoA hydratase/carnithine racemase [Rhodoligotrophos appendicifer]|uniref:crotonase/enoyl-CoA hydratase family protein n=1 Tax=Rhodoligotrophos appendicifer TaxID=987056 RepID=UPI001186A67C|nr:crotonase/enoyl-CoA hydratase family protein [Rhodoligotrophos appendicifer]